MADKTAGTGGRLRWAYIPSVLSIEKSAQELEWAKEHGGKQFSAFKNELADLAVSKLVPIAAEMRRLLADPAEVDALLRRGAEKARTIAHPIVTEVKHIVGFVS